MSDYANETRKQMSKPKVFAEKKLNEDYAETMSTEKMTTKRSVVVAADKKKKEKKEKKEKVETVATNFQFEYRERAARNTEKAKKEEVNFKSEKDFPALRA